jgi:hypothetical protein
MAHTVKRAYLYSAATLALLFTAAMAVFVLGLFLYLAGLRSYQAYAEGDVVTFSPLTTQEALQTMVPFLIAAVVGGLFGGGHYWLIRRDARGDPGADGGTMRHIFLNVLLALAELIAILAGLAALSDIDPTEGTHDPIFVLAVALAATLVFVLVFLERRRGGPVGRTASLIRQMQEKVMLGLLLIIASTVVISAIDSAIHWAQIKNHVVEPPTCIYISDFGAAEDGPCLLAPPLLSPILTALFAMATCGCSLWLRVRSGRASRQRP